VAVAVLTLTAFEIILGIDTTVFLSVLTGRLPATQRPYARWVGLLLTMGMRILLLTISRIMSRTKPLFEIASVGLTGQRLILLLGGAFLLWKAVKEIHHKVEGQHDEANAAGVATATMGALL